MHGVRHGADDRLYSGGGVGGASWQGRHLGHASVSPCAREHSLPQMTIWWLFDDEQATNNTASATLGRD